VGFGVQTGWLELSTVKWQYLLQESSVTDTVQEADVEDFWVTLTLFPSKESRQKRMLVVSFQQRELINGLLLKIPNISVNFVRSSDSQVFRLVREGDLDGVQKLVAQGLASIRDHDEQGRSLLFVSHSWSTE
jgi:hypothetical protein